MHMTANPCCEKRPGLGALTRIVALFGAVLTLAGCAGGFSQSLRQSLSVIAPAQIDFSELLTYAQRSEKAYKSIPEIEDAYPLTTRATTVTSVDVRYFIETDPGKRIQTISVRGTAERENVWEDIETALVDDSLLGIALHRGFRRDAAAVFNDATPYLRKDWPLHITGHSLGGAVAVVLAAYYEKEGFEVARVVTFGQPKVFAGMPEGQWRVVTTRVVNELDVVPLVPPFSPIRPYKHFTEEVILRTGPDFVYLKEHDAERISIGDFWRNIGDLSIKDHSALGYIANIKGKAANGARQVPYLFKQPPQS